MTAAAFDPAFRIVVGEEGGYDADPRDAGNYTGAAVGAGVLRGTKYGISAAAFPMLDIAALTLADAQAIYRRDYWDRIAGDALPDPLALMLFDAAVNQGVFKAATMLQSAVGVTQDGDIGPLTLAAVASADVLDTLAQVAWLRDCSYRQDAAWATYGHGWIKRLATVTALSLVYTQAPELARYLPHGVLS